MGDVIGSIVRQPRQARPSAVDEVEIVARRLIGRSGRDVLNGGSGDDEIQAFDGARDPVLCGSGNGDSAELDSVDTQSGCEVTAVHH